MMNTITGILLIIAVIASIFITIAYLHEKYMRNHRLRYERELAWQMARDEELAKEQHNAKLDEINRDYMDAMKAMELMEELERDKHDLR